MITAMLPNLPDGRPYTALEVVGGIASAPPAAAALEAARGQMESQAEALGPMPSLMCALCSCQLLTLEEQTR